MACSPEFRTVSSPPESASLWQMPSWYSASQNAVQKRVNCSRGTVPLLPNKEPCTQCPVQVGLFLERKSRITILLQNMLLPYSQNEALLKAWQDNQCELPLIIVHTNGPGKKWQEDHRSPKILNNSTKPLKDLKRSNKAKTHCTRIIEWHSSG